MKIKDTSKWNTEGDTKSLLFFAQRMDELLFQYSLDTYKPSSLNTPYLIIESLNIIKEIESEHLDESSIIPVLDELKWAVKNDIVAKSLLAEPPDTYILNPEHNKIKDIKLRLEILKNKIKPKKYIEESFKNLREVISTSQKKEIEFLAKTICTTLINVGLSKRFLHEEVNKFFFGENRIENINALDEFIEIITPRRRDFKVLFKVSSLFDVISESSEEFGIIIYKNDNELNDFNVIKNNFNIDNSKSYALLHKVTAFDCYSAVKIAETRIEKVSNLYALFHHKIQISWDAEAIVNSDQPNSEVKVRINSNPVKNGFDLVPTKAAKILNQVIKNLRLDGNSSFSKFDNVVDLHALAAKSDSYSSQIVNIWISLETLTPTSNSESKIRNIIKKITPFLMLNYTLRIIQRLKGDILRWSHKEYKKVIKSITSDSPDTTMKVLHLLAIKDNQAILNDLYAKLDNFPLLKNRIYVLSETFRDPKKVKHLLDSHMMKIEWQVKRIYRTRNMIVHSGKTPAYIESLVENSHDYLDQILNEIMISAGEKGECSTLEQCYELTKIKFSSYMNNLDKLESINEKNYHALIRNN